MTIQVNNKIMNIKITKLKHKYTFQVICSNRELNSNKTNWQF